MPATTASRSASSNTITGALPPSSRWVRLSVARRLHTFWPVATSPVSEIMRTPGCVDQRRAHAVAAAGDHVDDARAGTARRRSWRAERGQRRLLGGLEHHGVAGGERRRQSSTPPSSADSSRARSRRPRRRVAPDHAGVARQVLAGAAAAGSAPRRRRSGSSRRSPGISSLSAARKGLPQLSDFQRARTPRLCLDAVGELEQQRERSCGVVAAPALKARSRPLRPRRRLLARGLGDLGDHLAGGRVEDASRLAFAGTKLPSMSSSVAMLIRHAGAPSVSATLVRCRA